MRWYKFLIWFSLFLGALVNAVGGIMALTGAQYGEDAQLVYAFFGNGLKAFDVFYGVLLLGMAVATILVRQGLAHYKKEAPMCYLALMGANIALSVVYALGVSLITGLGFFSIFDASSWGTAIGTAILIVCNYFYFDKRKHLFCR